jgi:adenylate kinase family enzyme
MYLYQKALFSLPFESSVIFDGFNRKVPEAQLIIESLNWIERPFQVVNILISDEEAIKRISVRKLNSDRVDDAFVPERLKEFDKFTKDAIEIFRDAGVLVEVNGEQPPEKVAEDIRAALKV